MRIHAVVFRSLKYEDLQLSNVVFGRSARWAGGIRKDLRRDGWDIVRSEVFEVPKVKSGLIIWLNKHFKIID